MLRFAFVITSLLFLITGAPAAFGQQFSFRNWSVEDGLAQSQVYALLQDQRGLLWLGTRGGGLSCFDGQRFVNYTTREGLKDHYILSLAEHQDGSIWIGSNTGLSRFDGRKMQVLPIEGYPSLPVMHLMFSKRYGMIAGTREGVFRWNGQQLVPWLRGLSELSGEIPAMEQDARGNLWIAGAKSLMHFDGRNWRRIKTETQKPKAGITALEVDGQGIWIATYGEGLWRFEADSLRPVDLGIWIPDGIVQALCRDAEGRIWLGTQTDGLLRYRPEDGNIQHFGERDGLSNNHIRSLYSDPWGNLWIGSSGAGFSRFSGESFQHFNQRSGLPGRNVYALAEDTAGRIWLSTSAGGVACLDGMRVIDYSRAEGFPVSKSKKLFFDRLGRMWIGTEGDGLYVISGGGTMRFGLDNGLRGNWIRDIVQDEAGNFWVAKAGGGITLMREIAPMRFEMEHYDQRNGLPDDRINQLLCDGPRIWFVSAGRGAGFIENGSIQVIDKTRGLPTDHLRSIAKRGNEIWLGTEDAGIVRVEFGSGKWKCKILNTSHGLRSNTVYLLHADTRGQLWVGTEKGVDALEFSPNSELLKVRHYGAGEGFTGVETSQNAVLLDRAGKLWFGTINGMTSCNPNQGSTPLQAPVLRITQMTVGNQAIENSAFAARFDGWNRPLATLRLPGSGTAFGLSFHAIGYPNPDLLQYQWKLEGADGGWSKASTQNNISFSALEPGDYRLWIRAANEVGQWSRPIILPLHVNTPYWRNPWLIGAAFVGLLVLVWAVMRWRIGRIRRKAAEVQEKLRMESELIRLEQKALQLQMNPHFIFNALNSVQALIGSADEKTARYQLARFSKLMRLILEGSREEQLSLQQEMQMLENYLNLEQFIRGGHFQFTMEVRGGYQAEEVLLPAMMVHPFVENAVVHGLSGIDAGQLKIGFDVSETHVDVCIEDNGRGRAAAALLRRERDPEHKSTALKVVAERLSLSGIGEAPRVEDLNDNDGKPCGTRVWLRLPVKHVF